MEQKNTKMRGTRGIASLYYILCADRITGLLVGQQAAGSSPSAELKQSLQNSNPASGSVDLSVIESAIHARLDSATEFAPLCSVFSLPA
jgi:hypothetical protein